MKHEDKKNLAAYPPVTGIHILPPTARQLLYAMLQGEEHYVTPSVSKTRKPQAVAKILAYLTAHPDAQDTLEGIVEWWLLEQNIKHYTAQVKEALVELVAQELVVARKGRDSQMHYCISRFKYREIVDYLNIGKRNK